MRDEEEWALIRKETEIHDKRIEKITEREELFKEKKEGYNAVTAGLEELITVFVGYVNGLGLDDRGEIWGELAVAVKEERAAFVVIKILELRITNLNEIIAILRSDNS